MKIENIHLVYFSATYTTRKVLRELAGQIGGNIVEHDITNSIPAADIALGQSDLLIAGAPVYAGRIPARMADALKKVHGKGSAAVTVCVYGNRDYDDALLELHDCVEAQGFKNVAAGAFVARHCIFPQVAAQRPDAADMNQVDGFARKCVSLLDSVTDTSALSEIEVKGNRPYKPLKAIPLCPTARAARCNSCGTCAKQCPAGAIPPDALHSTDAARCMSCGRCTVVCPQHARAFRGLKYAFIKMLFTRKFSKRQEPETFFARLRS